MAGTNEGKVVVWDAEDSGNDAAYRQEHKGLGHTPPPNKNQSVDQYALSIWDTLYRELQALTD